MGEWVIAGSSTGSLRLHLPLARLEIPPIHQLPASFRLPLIAASPDSRRFRTFTAPHSRYSAFTHTPIHPFTHSTSLAGNVQNRQTANMETTRRGAVKVVQGVVVLLCGLAVGCGGEETANGGEVRTVTRDQQLLYTLDAGTEWIGAVGRDAQYRATSEAARTYAATLASDHQGIAGVLDRASQEAGIQPAESGMGRELLQAAQAARGALQGMTGPEYDLAFVEAAIRLQQRLLSGIDRDLAVLQNPQLREVAEQTRPTLEAHIRRGRQLLPEMRTAQANAPPVAPAAASSTSGQAVPRSTPQVRPAPTRTPADSPAAPRTLPDTSRSMN